ncbi:MAG: carbohydrate binding family 9 domain-containing protein [Acidobacteriia bacterium]|nr:carbohydrate binding family 9 domain-containing protein [Terriglobia bacterium]
MLLFAALYIFSFIFQEPEPAAPASAQKLEAAGPVKRGPATVINIPRIARPPKIEEFERPEVSRTDMLRLNAFVQRAPNDGTAPSQRTEIYLGYDHDNLYVVWMCYDREPGKIRAHMGRRENVFDDDYVEMMLDTFHDQRRAFVFSVNPLGIQADGLYTENGGGNDTSWDTVWGSWGRLTHFGYVVVESIPFRSLRFKPGEAGTAWGVTFNRSIPRSDESDFLPEVSQKQSGVLSQEATMTGFEGIHPGRNMQFNPYFSGSTFRSVNQDVPTSPVIDKKTFDGKVGLDAKFVFNDSLVLDATVEPDFSQVESDQPQNTVNQRFEVFFPEKRPFFLENSNIFETLSGFQGDRLLFTRRIADPQFGARLTGKEGPWTLGFFVADDRSPGRQVLVSDPLHDQRAYFAIGRLAYDLGKNSNIGLIYTDREFDGDFNRVGGLDAHFKLGKNWNFSWRSVVSTTRASGTLYSFGSDHDGAFAGEGQHFTFFGNYQDISPGFHTDTGFIRRTDIRRLSGYYHYYWRPKKGKLLLFGPELNADRTYDHSGLGVEYGVNFDWAFALHRNTVIAPIIGVQSDTLRPVDFSGLTFNRKFSEDFGGLVFRSSPLRQLSWNITAIRTGAVNVVVPTGQLPTEGDETSINAGITYKPFNGLQIDNTYIFDRVKYNRLGHTVFNNHILRSKWNYQFTPKFSLRAIAQYNGLLANPTFSSLTTTKNVNFDFLLTYLVHPGTAIYAGYNSNLENIDPGLCIKVAGACDPNGIGLLHRPGGPFLNDGRQVFVKVSYLWRP